MLTVKNKIQGSRNKEKSLTLNLEPFAFAVLPLQESHIVY